MEDKSKEIAFDFSSTYTDNLPKILSALNISLVVTSYQSDRLFFIRSNGKDIDTNFKEFERPMGIYADDNRITLGTFNQVLEFKRSNEILEKIKIGSLDNEEKFTKKVLEKDKEQMEELRKNRKKELEKVKNADTFFLPRGSITTGMINIHDIAWGDEGLWVVNSTFSCLSTLSSDYNFVARWKPPFITELVPEDRCHLNGMAMKNGRPKYVTTFSKMNEKDSWAKKNKHDGTLIDVDTNEILLDGLIMPHSPKYYKKNVYFCESGTGKVLKFNPETKELDLIIKLQGFPRGLIFYGELMFVGLSKSRASDINNRIPIDEEYDETYSGIWIINLEDNSEIAHIKFDGDIYQIYDIAIIKGAINPELITLDNSLVRHIFDFSENIM